MSTGTRALEGDILLDDSRTRNRLPTLLEVLSRRTQSPVDLFAFYVFMRDQQRSVDYLDFWLDVAQHMVLCRAFVRELRRSMLYETPDMEGKQGSKRSSQILHDLGEPGPSGGSLKSQDQQDQRLSAFLREGKDSGSHHASAQHSQKDSSESHHSRQTTPGGPGAGPGTGTGTGQTTPGALEQPRPSFMTSNFGDSSSPGTGNHSSPQHTVKRQDVKSSAEKILYTYLLQGAEREIIVPDHILQEVTEAIEEQGRDDPELFDNARDYVFAAMERDAFPGFLRARALGNLVPPSLLVRIGIGCVAMFGGWWAAFCLLFLDYTRVNRLYIILPFAVGVYMLVSHQYSTDPIMAFLGYSEITFMNFFKVKEPFVRGLLVKRALVACAWIIGVTAAWVVLFVFVPGKRL
ncbi:MAG: Bud site selection protein, Revert to axial protein 1 [Alyxoria varia]|nr:MAG: Bud site selection protein, Revert to axial protein 1 [Alyxoria varia]